MVYKKTREKRLRMSVVLFNREHKIVTKWLKKQEMSWQQFLINHIMSTCKQIEETSAQERLTNLKLSNKSEVTE
jgi:uncharacterized protein YacL (UPF0231 family)